jgi:hypothetical protein
VAKLFWLRAVCLHHPPYFCDLFQSAINIDLRAASIWAGSSPISPET